MNGAEERAGSVAAQKQRIRERYKGVDADLLEVIPAIPPEDIFHGMEKKRVGVYARVSTDDPRQTSSYELQKNHYEDVVSRNPNWELVKIYADATVIIGLKQNPTIGRRFSPIFSFIEHLSGKYGRCYT